MTIHINALDISKKINILNNFFQKIFLVFKEDNEKIKIYRNNEFIEEISKEEFFNMFNDFIKEIHEENILNEINFDLGNKYGFKLIKGDKFYFLKNISSKKEINVSNIDLFDMDLYKKIVNNKILLLN